MIAALGMPPSEFVLQGRLGVREEWFDDEGSCYLVLPFPWACYTDFL
jgi:hypothetical protein